MFEWYVGIMLLLILFVSSRSDAGVVDSLKTEIEVLKEKIESLEETIESRFPDHDDDEAPF
jgi:hypothetical protein